MPSSLVLNQRIVDVQVANLDKTIEGLFKFQSHQLESSSSNTGAGLSEEALELNVVVKEAVNSLVHQFSSHKEALIHLSKRNFAYAEHATLTTPRSGIAVGGDIGQQAKKNQRKLRAAVDRVIAARVRRESIAEFNRQINEIRGPMDELANDIASIEADSRGQGQEMRNVVETVLVPLRAAVNNAAVMIADLERQRDAL